MGIDPGEAGDVAAVLLLGDGAVFGDQLLQRRITGAVAVVDGDELPGIAVDGIGIGVDHKVEPAHLVGAGDRLHDGDARHHAGFFQIGVGVAADDEIHPPAGVQQRRQLLVLLKADVGQQHGEVDVLCPVGVADPAHLRGGVMDIDEGADEPLLPGGGQHLLGEHADEQHPHPAHLQNDVAVKEPDLVGGEVQIGVDDGKAGAFFQKQQMSDAVVDLVVAQGGHIGGEHIHDLDGGQALELAVDHRAPEHIPRNGVEDIFFLAAHLLDVAGEQGHAAHQPAAFILRQKVPVHIVGVEEGQFLQMFHGVCLPFIRPACRRRRYRRPTRRPRPASHGGCFLYRDP